MRCTLPSIKGGAVVVVSFTGAVLLLNYHTTSPSYFSKFIVPLGDFSARALVTVSRPVCKAKGLATDEYAC